MPCPRCHGSRSETQVSRYRERERQVQLAKERGEEHIGDQASQIILAKAKKKSLKKQN